MKRVLVLNLGSTSFKCKLYDMDGGETLLAGGSVESIGGEGAYDIQAPNARDKGPCACASHMDALRVCLQAFGRNGVPLQMEELDAVGYKAVHGGSLSGSHLVDGALLAEMERMATWAPAHNPVYVAMMKSVRDSYPGLVQIACFETAFHATIPLERAVYGVPYEWIGEYGLRRYGFHGSSHSYIAWKMRREAPTARRVISAHLGGSSSLCAMLDGKSVATSMGATPQSGLFHNNRVGDLDVFALAPLADRLGGLEKVMGVLAGGSGFLGLSGVSNDLRAVQDAAAGGNQRAELAIAAFADAVVGYIGMYTAFLGGLDALVFTGGIGQNAAGLRSRVARKLSFLSAKLDESRNKLGVQGRVSAGDSGLEIWVWETNEELMVARGCMQWLRG